MLYNEEGMYMIALRDKHIRSVMISALVHGWRMIWQYCS